MFTKLIRGLLSAFGIIKKTKKFTTANNTAFMQSLAAGTVILTAARDPNFLQKGIQGATDSLWQHALLYVGKTAGSKIRQKFPYLLANPKLSKDSQYHEIVEAQGEGVIVATLENNLGDNQFMVAYTRQLTEDQLETILHRIYSNIGKPYDILEFIGDAFPDGLIQNPGNLFVCSSLVANAYLPIERIAKKEVDVRKATPKDLNDYLEPNLAWNKTSYNC
jgi:hypothetical protein